MKLAAVVALLCTVAMAQTPSPAEKPKADLILLHGNIYTGVKRTTGFVQSERVEAMAIRGDRIVAVGQDSEISKLQGPGTQVIDLHGRFVMPGFNDAHVHLSSGGFEKLNVDLVGVKSLSEFRERIKQKAEAAAAGEWIVGRGWDETLWPVKSTPTRWDVDEVSAGHPVFVQRVDGHIAVANTKALQAAGITVASKEPAGGKIDRDESGAPTGILRERAREAVFAAVPKPTHDKRKQAIDAALADAVRWGITSAQDNSAWEDFLVFEELEREGKLPIRITEWLPFDDPVEELKSSRDSHPASDPMLHTGMLKGFMDGSLGSHTAALLQPYSDDPQNTGLPQYDAAKLNEMAKERVEAGFQLGFHAIGDKGVQLALDAFAGAEKDALEKKVKAANGGEDFRLRIEHAQVTTPAEIDQFKSLKVVASMQPNHLLTDMNWAQARLGPQRAAHSYAWAELLRKEVTLAFGTDYPVEPITPFRGVYAAVTRKSEDGKTQYYPEQKLTIDEALTAYTAGSAFAEFSEKDKGVLKPGMLADFVVLDRDLTAVVPAKILQTKVLRTVVGGKTVYEAK
ncbi:MAG TPA: amidohydrolase [Terriglobales bacterium]